MTHANMSREMRRDLIEVRRKSVHYYSLSRIKRASRLSVTRKNASCRPSTDQSNEEI